MKIRLTLLTTIGAIFLAVIPAAIAQTCTCYDSRGGICYDMVCHAGTSTSTSTSGSSGTSNSSRTANVTVLIRDDADPIGVGDTLTYTITLRNSTNKNVTEDVTAFLDTDTSFVSASDDGDDTSSDEVEWNDVRVGANDTEVLTLRVRPDSNLRDGDSVRLKVQSRDSKGTSTDSETTEIDQNGYYCSGRYCTCGTSSSCNSSSTGYTTGDVALSITDNTDPVRPGDYLTYRIQLTNLSSGTRTLDVTGYLDSNTTFSSASDNGTVLNGNSVQWHNIRLYGNQTDEITVQVLVRSSVSYGSTLYFSANTSGSNDSETTAVQYSSSYFSSSGDVCTYYNSYTRQNYQDYCDSRHQRSQY